MSETNKLARAPFRWEFLLLVIFWVGLSTWVLGTVAEILQARGYWAWAGQHHQLGQPGGDLVASLIPLFLLLGALIAVYQGKLVFRRVLGDQVCPTLVNLKIQPDAYLDYLESRWEEVHALLGEDGFKPILVRLARSEDGAAQDLALRIKEEVTRLRDAETLRASMRAKKVEARAKELEELRNLG